MSYWLADVTIETILQSEYLKEDESYPDDGAHRHSIFLVEIDEAVDLTASV